MTLKINAIKPVIVENKSYFKQNKKNELPSFQINNNYITGVPRGYITFKAKDDDIKLTDDAVVLYESAKNIARAWGHNEITPYHIIEAAIEETFNNLNNFIDGTTDIQGGGMIGAILSVSLVKLVSLQGASVVSIVLIICGFIMFSGITIYDIIKSCNQQ